jgi:L,D-peptidoglycan transpeptidase YkuD (ErfK/YbiS/YcfS/YnhG family)
VTTRRRRALGAAIAAVVVLLGLAGGAYLLGGRPGDTRGVSAPADLEPADRSSPPSSAPPSGDPSVPATASQPASATPSATPGASTAGAPRPANVASRLRTLPAGTRQVIVVSADGYGSTTATFEAFNKVDGGWHPAFGAMTARVGAKGFADRKTEGDLTTPTGVYSIGTTMYGIAGNPGVRYGYHRLVADDWWNENPATPGYNTFVHGPDPGGAREALWQISPQYDYFAVINYNTPVTKADPPRGSGIFLHVMVPGRATAGCVSLSQPDLLKILRWLDPQAAPRMVMAPRSALPRY